VCGGLRRCSCVSAAKTVSRSSSFRSASDGASDPDLLNGLRNHHRVRHVTPDMHRLIVAAAALVALCARAATAQPERPIGILLAAGDISTCGSNAWHRYADKTADLIRTAVKDAGEATPPIPVRVLALGDLAYGKGTPEQFTCFGKRWSGFDDVLLPVPGNHEYLTDHPRRTSSTSRTTPSSIRTVPKRATSPSIFPTPTDRGG
jgi:hypothetical protein